ncbi:hypothetical protein BDD43_3859 [Mucilaginibacter gracilis]|uniref:MORN repeat protein n=1 Tax=Mucilaginibacter gracilis TaxID=423350 RepID=A0A495J3W4_9SPHI|nr:hypothetical protein [Mucilaginibacter gracilis]RKR83647.1 hypothetical protein BDD43_3859 [Mucilaginibacter gracilis]
MLRSVLLFCLLSTTLSVYAQETIELSNNYSPDIIQKYHAFKDNRDIKHGAYQAFYKKKTVVASGLYTQGKRTGVWHFYDIKGNITQHYNYDKNQLLYVTDEDPTGNFTKYEFIPKPAATDSVTFPIKIGGLLYGYQPYLKMFRVDEVNLYNPASVYAVLEILVTPFGQLAECKLMVKTKVMVNFQIQETNVATYLLNNDLLSPEDKQFLPASVNRQPVSSTIYIYCNVQSNGRISIF